MRRFFIQIALFISLFALVFIPITFHQRAKLDRVLEKEAKLAATTTVLVVGDSHTQCSLDPSSFPEMENRSAKAEEYFYTFAKVRYYIGNNPSLKVLVLSFSEIRLTKSNEGVCGKDVDKFYPAYMNLIRLFPDQDMFLLKNGDVKLYLTHAGVVKWGIPSSSTFKIFEEIDEPTPFRGGFMDKDVFAIDRMDVDDAIDRHYKGYDANNPAAFISHFELEYLHKILSYATDRGVKVVLFNAPCHWKYNERVPEPIRQQADSIIRSCEKKYGITYLNMVNYPLSDSLFRDYDHLNNRGAVVITPIVRDSLIKKGILTPRSVCEK